MKKNTKKLIALATALTFAVGLVTLTGCGSGSSSDDKVIKVGASPTPHAEILKAVESEVEKQGYKLKIVEFEDYVKPNQALADGDLDANYFQHKPYLDDYNKKNGTDLVSAGTVHYEPIGIYKGTKSTIASLSSGDKVGVPNDTTNEARALLLLQAQGVIKLRDGVGLDATKADIVSNPKNIEIEELDAAIIPKSLPDLALGVINGNYALGADLTSADCLAYEAADSEAASEYANIVAVRKEDLKSKKTKVLVKALQSATAKKYIEKTYKGTVELYTD